MAIVREERRVIPWLPDYDISQSGEVRRITAAATRGRVPYTINGGDDGRGYLRVKLYAGNGIKKSFLVHRLVCEAFNGPPTAEANIAAHWDGDKRNNNADNLRWTNPRGNADDSKRLGEVAGVKNGRSILSERDVVRIRRQFTGEYGQIAALAREYGVSHSAMWQTCRGTCWRHV